MGGIDIPIHWGEDFYLANKLARAGYKVIIEEDPLYHATHLDTREWIHKDRLRSRDFSRTGGYEGLTRSDPKSLIASSRLFFLRLIY